MIKSLKQFVSMLIICSIGITNNLSYIKFSYANKKIDSNIEKEFNDENVNLENNNAISFEREDSIDDAENNNFDQDKVDNFIKEAENVNENI